MTPAPTPIVRRSDMSSWCRNEQHDTCVEMDARCQCPCHTAPSMPLRAQPEPEPSARRESNVPVAGLEWGTPPGIRRTFHDALDHITPDMRQQLRDHPGEWAKVLTWRGTQRAAMAVAQRIRVKNALGPGWDAASHIVGTGSELWITYEGDDMGEGEG